MRKRKDKRNDTMKEFKSTDKTLNAIYKSLYELLEDTEQERVFAIGVLTGAVLYSYSEDEICHKEYWDLLNGLQEKFNAY